MLISISRALVSSKHTSAAVMDFLSNRVECTFSFIARSNKNYENGNDLVQSHTNIKQKYKSVTDKIDSIYNTHVKISESNAATVIKFGDKEMTIANALIYRHVAIPKLRSLLSAMQSDRTTRLLKFESLNGEYLNNLKKIQSEGESNISTESPYSVITLDNEIAELEKLINTFELELDAALTEMNALVKIEV